MDDKVEEIRATPYGTVATGSDSTTLTETGEPGGVYTRSWTVTAGTPAVTTKTVVVTVGWSGRTSHQVQLQTIVAQ